MRRLRAFWRRVPALFGRRAGDDFSAELESHLQMHIEDNLRTGMSCEEARRDALIKLGGLEQVKQAYRERETLPVAGKPASGYCVCAEELRKSPGFNAYRGAHAGAGQRSRSARSATSQLLQDEGHLLVQCHESCYLWSQ